MSYSTRTIGPGDRWVFDDNTNQIIGIQAPTGQGYLPLLPAASVTATQALVSDAGNKVSTKCFMCIPTLQQPTSGAARDVSGRGNDLVLGSTVVDATLWGDTSRELNSLAVITDNASATGLYLYAPSLSPVWDMSTEWFIFSFLIKPTATVRAVNLISAGTAGVAPGWYVKLDATGKLYLVTVNNALTVGGNQASTASPIVVGRTVHVTYAVDPTIGGIYLYLNGVLANQWTGQFTGPGVSTQRITTASAASTVNNAVNNTYGALYGGIQYYKGTGALPPNHAAIANRLAVRPFEPLSIVELS